MNCWMSLSRKAQFFVYSPMSLPTILQPNFHCWCWPAVQQLPQAAPCSDLSLSGPSKGTPFACHARSFIRSYPAGPYLTTCAVALLASVIILLYVLSSPLQSQFSISFCTVCSSAATSFLALFLSTASTVLRSPASSLGPDAVLYPQCHSRTPPTPIFSFSCW